MYHKFEGSYTNSGKIRPPENIVSLQLSQKKYTGPKKMPENQMVPKFMFLGWRGRERERERQREGGGREERLRIHLSVESELWHSTENSLGPREKWWHEDYDSGIHTRLQLAQQTQSSLQEKENSLFWMLVVGHRTAEGRRGQSSLVVPAGHGAAWILCSRKTNCAFLWVRI